MDGEDYSESTHSLYFRRPIEGSRGPLRCPGHIKHPVSTKGEGEIALCHPSIVMPPATGVPDLSKRVPPMVGRITIYSDHFEYQKRIHPTMYPSQLRKNDRNRSQ